MAAQLAGPKGSRPSARPKASAEYAKIGFSPINRMTDIQARHLESQLQELRPGLRVIVVNRYTSPTADEVLEREDLVGKRIFIIPCIRTCAIARR